MTRTQAWRLAFSAAVLLGALPIAPARGLAAETYQYDPVGRLTDIAYQNGGSLHYTYDSNGNILSIVTSLATSVDENGGPLSFALGPTTPNPASGPRTLVFTTPAQGHVALRVFDVSGREVSALVDRDLPAGRHVASFTTERWAAGVYYYKLTLGSQARDGKLIVLR